MRDRSSWHSSLVRLLKPWPTEHQDTKPAVLCQVELGLRLLERIAPDESADSVWTLLSGYPFALASGLGITPSDQEILYNARQLLWTLRRRRLWQQSLEAYRRLPERLRAYRVPVHGGPAHWVEPRIAGGRLALYDNALDSSAPFSRTPLPPATAGSHRFTEQRRYASVTIPEGLALSAPNGHDLKAGRPGEGGPIDVPLAELMVTAQWMDQQEPGPAQHQNHWEERLNNLRLDTRHSDGVRFEPATVLRLDQLVHMVGMVGAGKSTLMMLIAVWAALRGLRTTLVVGDVAEQLTLTAQFRELFRARPDLDVAPVMGGTMRERHTQRVHRRLTGRGKSSLLLHESPAFTDLSTACPLDALRGIDAHTPLRFADAPCTGLHPARTPGSQSALDTELAVLHLGDTRTADQAPGTDRDGDWHSTAHGCPLWSGCPRHNASRRLVNALVWVANPMSLVQTSVPRNLNEERIRYLELAALRSDIIIVDEVDRVQMGLDRAFAPSATLVVPGRRLDSWLDRLDTHKIEELARQSRLPLADRDVQRWAASLGVVSNAANRLYALLISNPGLQAWVETDYFSAWTLQEKLLADWYPRPHDDLSETLADELSLYDLDEALDPTPDAAPPPAAGREPWAARRNELTHVMDVFRDDPLGDLGPHGPDSDLLTSAAQDLLHTLAEGNTRARVHKVLERLLDGAPDLNPVGSAAAGQRGSTAWLECNAERLEFTLLLATLHHRLDQVSFLWPQVEATLHLDASGNDLSRRPPLDYASVIPESPMGNVLGFQYLPDERDGPKDADGLRSGTLRFFRCAGVGRELLYSLPRLGADPDQGRPGPNVLLMSGSSWAGTSTRAHVLAPVQAVLRPRADAIDRISKSVFRTQFVYYSDGTPIRLSGARRENHDKVLRTMVWQLGKPGPAETAGLLQRELARIPDQHRRRALLLVGSYRDALTAADVLQQMDRWRTSVRVLIADDADLEQDLATSLPGTVRRGDLASFAEDDTAELLVAPLLAVERGHNILTVPHRPGEERVAAFGTVLFLTRPHPVPDDLYLSVFAINDWVTRFARNLPGLQQGTFSELVAKAGGLDSSGLAFRHAARAEWRRLLSRRYMYSRLTLREKESFAWDQLTTIWQVIGRLVRGGVPARVVFVDAAFAPALAASLAPESTVQEADPRALTDHDLATPPDRSDASRRWELDDGLLSRLRQVLAPYFSGRAEPADAALVRALYQPLYDALSSLET
ncbi:hypothetical protein ACFV84_09680 [Kitasatospora sp. NPDC059811]|uniref:pPIWI_RE_Z domain-containing protein n=1 Tax=Streptomycetaceae TaxID=2062 RepID=UPI0007AFCF41|nr:hypothetical protein [Streptomyces sp. MJM8645]